MPEYISPGVYIEETAFRGNHIEGVSTHTTGFVGAARYGPVGLEPDIINSLAEFERVYGDGRKLEFDGGAHVTHNYLWHAARAFFAEGGKRLHIGRIFRPLHAGGDADDLQRTYRLPGETLLEDEAHQTGALYSDGHARAFMRRDAETAATEESILIRARFPGAAGNMRVRFTVKLGLNILSGADGNLAAGTLRAYDTVWLRRASGLAGDAHGVGFRVAHYDEAEQTWIFSRTATATTASDLRLNTPPDSGFDALSIAVGDEARIATLTVCVTSADGSTTHVWDDIALDPRHLNTSGTHDSLKGVFSPHPGSRIPHAHTLPVVLVGDGISSGVALIETLIVHGAISRSNESLSDNLLNRLDSTESERSVDVPLAGGNDGRLPCAVEYAGSRDAQTGVGCGLVSFESLEDISIVAAPGATAGYSQRTAEVNAIVNALVAHAELMRYRIALIDSGEAQSISEVRAMRAEIDSMHAVFYYPWIRALDPLTNNPINLPPSGFVAGIYARSDIKRGVHRAPANEPVNLAVGLEKMINSAQLEALTPEGINCFRFFGGGGFRLWGARTASSEREWRYVNLRRYFAYLEHSIDRGTRWAVYEPNNSVLWNDVRRSIENFLYNEYRAGVLSGDKPENSFYVRCDRSTMTQSDLDEGRLVCRIGVALLRPAEFVVLRIGQWTADRKD